MADIVSKETRSRMMAQVRNKNTKPEMRVRRALHAAGFRFRLHRRDLAGRPDVVLPKYRTAVFVHGCFWHGHDCPRGKRPSSNAAFWAAKIETNIARDLAAVERLSAAGWRVETIWECDLEEKTRTLIARLNSVARTP
ncbi:very short patch repair endonuclease [Sphingomonas sp.]|uniref:very short patch repair endonuclease n=1 Tax=Sphingomonas sp. TaxID=28214 RepID=UPI001B0951D3|nr:very short patch repair endonuclease [Sphingomonas sp.]MBO9712470.1 DNA mismatch endonuclease Vsr [Sphingomonas sp.]